MSIENIKSFFALVEKDESLQKQFNIIEKPTEAGQGAGFAKLIDIAASVGFDFTVGEYEKFEDEIRASAQGELSEPDLDNVAGGICVFGRGGPFNNCKVALLLHVY